MGSIYESFLEFQLEKATEPMVYLKKGKGRSWIKLTTKVESKLEGHEPKANKGELFFTPDNKDRKTSGSYYTPHHVVTHIIEDTLSPIVSGLSSEEILKLRICDPAMGSGHFLNGVLDYISWQYLDAIENEVVSSSLPSLMQVKRDVLDNCIFGSDINPRAVKLAKMSLWLESAYKGKKLKEIDDQLISADTLLDNNLWTKYPGLDNGGFDAVVGNPPYVRQETIKDIKPELEKKFGDVYSGTADLYVYFFSKSISLLKKGGRLGFITSNKFIQSGYAKKLRSWLASSTKIESLVDQFEEKQVFKDAGVDPAILITENVLPPKNHSLSYNGVDGFAQSNLGSGSWEFRSESEGKIQEKLIEKGLKIKNIGEIQINFGIKSGANNIYIVDQDTKDILSKKETKNVVFKKMIRGRDIKDMRANYKGLWLIKVEAGKKIAKKSDVYDYFSLHKE
ncbi:MAG: Eco57I restriction-modification methylase domain-containing protein [Bdellovibrionales bacterium]|nr:Eco57I restriction-modification methylase domain-containing protein [Bdellovibrionales bacterium]